MANRFMVSLLGGGALFISQAALAQADSDQPSSASASGGTQPTEAADDAENPESSNDIFVTARRFSERLQLTPVAVTALPSSLLTERSVFNTAEIARMVPSLNIRTGGGSQTQSFIFIRGIGQGNDNPSLEPGVGIYVDDVFLPRSQGGLLDLNDVAQIEVLRGPQGTLYGKNTIGGAIRYTSRLPDNDPSAMLIASYGRYDEERVSLAVNQPIVADRLSVRISGTIRHRDGFYDNLFDGRRLNDRSSASGRVMLRYTPSPRWDFLWSGDIYHDRSLDVPNRLLQRNPTPALGAIEAQVGSLAPFVLSPGGDPRRGGGSDVRYDNDIRFTPFVDLIGTSFHAAWLGEAITVKSITAYRELHTVRTLDVDGTPRRVLNIADETRQHQFSQEFQLNGNLASGRLLFVGGLFYYDEDITNDFRQTIAPLGVRTDRLNDIGTESFAGYLNLTWRLTDRLSATAGARYTTEDRSLNSTLRSLPTLAVAVPTFGNSRNYSDFSPKFEVDYRFSDDIFFYLSAAKGFKSGGFNNQASNAAQLFSFEPETAWSYEGGLRTQWLHRRATLNVTGFYTDYKNLQLNVFGAFNGQLIPVVTNAAAARIYGLEIESQINPFEGLTLFGNFSWNGSKYQRFVDPVLGDLSNRRIPNIARYSYFVGGQLHRPLAGHLSLRASVDYSWRSSLFLDAVNTPIMRVPSYGILNARAGLDFGNGLEVALFGKNLTNEQVLESGSQALGSLGIAWGAFSAPTTYGVEAVWRF